MIDGSGQTDSELFERARSGDRAAFGDLVERHKDGLVNYLTRLSGSLEQAEDLAQEAFLRLYERGGRYREQGKLQAYLYRIGTNLLRSQRRPSRKMRISSSSASGTLSSSPSFSPEARFATIFR